MRKTILLGGKSLFTLSFGISALLVFSFVGGFWLGTLDTEDRQPIVPVSDKDFRWLFKVLSIDGSTSRTSIVGPPAFFASTPLGRRSLESSSMDDEVVPVSDENRLQVCLDLPCKVFSQDWEWNGFSARNVKMLTEQLTFTQSMRGECERVLSAASTNRVAQAKLECMRTRHREAQCAALLWNNREVLPHDANGGLLIRSAVALNLLVDFHNNNVKYPHWISLCVGDIRHKYGQWVQAEILAYHKHLSMPGNMRNDSFEKNFCQEQARDILSFSRLDAFSRTDALEAFEFPVTQLDAEVVSELQTLACGDGDARDLALMQ